MNTSKLFDLKGKTSTVPVKIDRRPFTLKSKRPK